MRTPKARPLELPMPIEMYPNILLCFLMSMQAPIRGREIGNNAKNAAETWECISPAVPLAQGPPGTIS